MTNPSEPHRGHEIVTALRTLHEPGSVFEIRIPHAARLGTVSGYFDDVDEAARAVAALDCHVQGIYVTLNPVDPALLGRANKRLVERAERATQDTEILRRCWLLVDIDPVRPAGVSASDAEKAAAEKLAIDVSLALHQEGWPYPVGADSGNGSHLLWRIDLPNDDESKVLVQRDLQALDVRFSDGVVKVDIGVFNSARITKLYGTLVCKGDSMVDRPHRRSALLRVPPNLQIVPRERLEKLAATLPAAEQPARNSKPHGAFDLDEFLGKHAIETRRERATSYGRVIELSVCPFDSSHDRGEACVGQRPDGAVWFKCQHASCADRHWTDFREIYEPGYKEKRASNEGLAVRANGERTTPSPDFMRAYDFAHQVENDVPYLVEGLLPAGGTATIVAKPKVGKSTLALSLSLAVARGDDFLGRATRQEAVLYVALEGSKSEWQRLLRALGVTAADSFYFHHGRRPEDVNPWLRNAVEKYRPGLITFDTLQRLVKVKNMNDYAELSNAMDPYIEFARTSAACALFVHHGGKSEKSDPVDTPLGSTAIAGSVDTLFYLKRGAAHRTLQTVQRSGDDMPETIITMDPETRRVSLGGTMHEANENVVGQAILTYLAGANEPVDEPSILENVAGRKSLKQERLRILVGDRAVLRSRAGKRGEPYLYRRADAEPETPSDVAASLPPTIAAEAENQNPETREKPGNDSVLSTSRDLRLSATDRGQSPESGRQYFEPDSDVQAAGPKRFTTLGEMARFPRARGAPS